MWEEDQPKITFITNGGVFYYKVMPFSLKNAKAIYQKMMNKVFKDQIGKNLEVYVDDLLIKSRSLDDHLANLEENFIVMQRNKVKINLAKCTFKVTVVNF